MVLTWGEYWQKRVGGMPLLFWAMEGIKDLASECWIHFVYEDNSHSKDLINESVLASSWIQVGDSYPVKEKMSTSKGLSMAFPSYGVNSGCYVFDARTILAPDLVEYMGDIDWFPYANQGTGGSWVVDQKQVHPLGLYSFSNYQQYFKVSHIIQDPVQAYGAMELDVVSFEVPTTTFKWVNTEASVEEFALTLR
jgi:hypothetical protein